MGGSSTIWLTPLKGPASWASGGYQEVVEGWWGASLLWQSCRVPAQWLSILVRLWGQGGVRCQQHSGRNLSQLKFSGPEKWRTKDWIQPVYLPCLVRLWTVFYYALNLMPLRPLPQFPSLCIYCSNIGPLQPTSLRLKIQNRDALLTALSPQVKHRASSFRIMNTNTALQFCHILL